MIRYREDGQIVFCYGDSAGLHVSFKASVAVIRRTCTTPSAGTRSMSSAGLRIRTWLREMEWISSLAGQIWTTVSAAVVLGLGAKASAFLTVRTEDQT